MVFDHIMYYVNENLSATLIQLFTTIPYSLAFWRSKKKNVLIWVAISNMLFAIGYFLFSAYSGVIVCAGTIIAVIIGLTVSKTDNEYLKNKLFLFMVITVATIIACVIIEQNVWMWMILAAGALNYFTFIVMREYGKLMHLILIVSQGLLVVYEIMFSLYIFAMLDLITMLVILLHFTRIQQMPLRPGEPI